MEEKNSGTWWKILLIVLVVLIIILLLLKFCSGRSSKTTVVTYESVSTKICDAAKTYTQSNATNFTNGVALISYQDLINTNLIDNSVIGNYNNNGTQKSITLNGRVKLIVQSNGDLACELIENADVNAPVINLKGDYKTTLYVGTEYEEPGYTATDQEDGDVTAKVTKTDNIDMNKAGTYTVNYTVQDSVGNVTTVTRTVVYELLDLSSISKNLDNESPKLTIVGPNPYCMLLGGEFKEPGAYAVDNIDGNITDRIVRHNIVSGKKLGIFRLVYKVQDSDKNEATTYRAVVVAKDCSEFNLEESNKE